MKDWPQIYREDIGVTERICPHGVGHPDPDQPWPADDWRWVHGCDGCCRPNNMPNGLYPASEWKPGNHHAAFDWSAHDQEDIPGEVKRQMHAESAHGTNGSDTVKLAKVSERAALSPSVKSAAGPTPLLSTLKKRAGDTAAPETPSPYAKAIKIRKPRTK